MKRFVTLKAGRHERLLSKVAHKMPAAVGSPPHRHGRPRRPAGRALANLQKEFEQLRKAHGGDLEEPLQAVERERLDRAGESDRDEKGD